jgi:CRISPR-associated protein Csm2
VIFLKKCKNCGRPLKDDKFDTCFDCYKKLSAALPNDYLAQGYFDEKGFLYIDLITDTAEKVAKALGNSNPSLTSNQLRKYFTHAKSAQNSLKLIGSYDDVKVNIHKLKSFAAEAVGKKKVPETFHKFIVKNLSCVTDEKSFNKGFMEHFQAVVAYFYYYFPKK